jgi:hypothetical protein
VPQPVARPRPAAGGVLLVHRVLEHEPPSRQLGRQREGQQEAPGQLVRHRGEQREVAVPVLGVLGREPPPVDELLHDRAQVLAVGPEPVEGVLHEQLRDVHDRGHVLFGQDGGLRRRQLLGDQPPQQRLGERPVVLGAEHGRGLALAHGVEVAQGLLGLDGHGHQEPAGGVGRPRVVGGEVHVEGDLPPGDAVGAHEHGLHAAVDPVAGAEEQRAQHVDVHGRAFGLGRGDLALGHPHASSPDPVRLSFRGAHRGPPGALIGLWTGAHCTTRPGHRRGPAMNGVPRES